MLQGGHIWKTYWVENAEHREPCFLSFNWCERDRLYKAKSGKSRSWRKRGHGMDSWLVCADEMGTNRFVMMAGHHCPYLVTESYIWNNLMFFLLFLVTFFVCFCFNHSHERSLFSTYFLQAGISLYCRKLYTPGRHELAPVFVNGKMTLVQWPRFPWRERA